MLLARTLGRSCVCFSRMKWRKSTRNGAAIVVPLHRPGHQLPHQEHHHVPRHPAVTNVTVAGTTAQEDLARTARKAKLSGTVAPRKNESHAMATVPTPALPLKKLLQAPLAALLLVAQLQKATGRTSLLWCFPRPRPRRQRLLRNAAPCRRCQRNWRTSTRTKTRWR